MSKSRLDVLFLEWTSKASRDTEISTPIYNYLKLNKYNVEIKNIYSGFFFLKKLKPKILFLPNIIGSDIHHLIALYARKLRITVITSLSEGFENIFHSQLNINKQLIPNEMFLWNENSRKVLSGIDKKLSEISFVLGCPGFDRHIIEKNISLPLNKHSHRITAVLWSWQDYNPINLNYKSLKLKLPKDIWSKINENRTLFNKMILGIVEIFPNIEFVLKRHPGSIYDIEFDGIEGLDAKSNVIIIKNEKSISELLKTSDILFTYDSTVALEAWLLGKATYSLQPNRVPDEFMLPISVKQENLTTLEELELVIRNFYKNSNKGTVLMSDEKKKFLEDNITYIDGLSHVRYGNQIIKNLNNNHNAKKFNYNYSLKEIYLTIRFRIAFIMYALGLNKKRTSGELLKDWNSKELNNSLDYRLDSQIRFYQKLGKNLDELRDL